MTGLQRNNIKRINAINTNILILSERIAECGSLEVAKDLSERIAVLTSEINANLESINNV